VGTTARDDGEARPWTVAVSFTSFETDLSFDGDRARIWQQQLGVIAAWTQGDFTLSFGAVAILDGNLSFHAGPPSGAKGELGSSHALRPGLAGTVGLAYRAAHAADSGVDLTLSLQLAAASTSLARRGTLATAAADRASWLAFDVRAGATISRTFEDVLTLYGSLRLFGGPIRVQASEGAESITGSDLRHVQLASGISLQPLPVSAPAVRLFIEAAMLSERGFTTGAAFSF